MKNIIYLKDYYNVVLNEAINRNNKSHIRQELIISALENKIKDNLRYNIKTGKTYEDGFTGCRGEYSNKEGIPSYNSNEEAAIWEFTGIVRSECSIIKHKLQKA